MLKQLPRTSGVYQIRCASNGKIYIGSAVDIRKRCELHRRSLRKGNHHNVHLQAAWNKYGEDNFEYTVLKLAETSDLLRVEQAWLDHTGCADKKIGFNIFKIAGSPGDTYAQVWEGFIDPNGNDNHNKKSLRILQTK